MKIKIKPTRFHIYLVIVVAISVLIFFWHVHNLKQKKSSANVRPVATMPPPADPPGNIMKEADKQPAQIKNTNIEKDLDLSGRTGLQYVGRHPPFDINAVEDSQEKLQEQPAGVDYGSPNPFKFEAHPEWAVQGTGYGNPANEYSNEMFARY